MTKDTQQKSSDEPIPGEGYKPAEVYVIDTPERLKIIGDPLRLKILDLLRQEALTVKQISARLEQPPTRLYYHVAEMEAAGFVTQVDTRVKSGIIEKYYRTSADLFTVAPGLLNAPGEHAGGLTSLLAAIFQTTVDDIVRSLAAGLIHLPEMDNRSPDDWFITGSNYRLRKEKAPEFVKKIGELIGQLGAEEDLLASAGADGKAVSYGITIAFYPRVEAAEAESEKKDI
jgi:DNA-binding transcriptional ArsR family regulator